MAATFLDAISPTLAIVMTGLMTGVVTPAVSFALTEYRLSRQRKWDSEDRARIQAETTLQIEAVHAGVTEAKNQASRAFHEANGVNVWRAEFTQDMHARQSAMLAETTQLRDLAVDTNDKMNKQLSRPVQPPLIILPPMPTTERKG